ncbi:pilus assembly protein TadG-related protein [Streptacidiphilus griseoplanus]|uniref:pilus assembly protein TadG-related protein n=1 Tax=Peterkaempfera griseoplana TaxID=66896 RepID=UPI0006E19223|nr:pilus assembly protein TadG-related protein [Peterkaempfera griseoplana]
MHRSAARPDGGSISIFVALCAVGLLVVIGIVIDCGGRLRAVERADALAQEAARAAGQQLDPAAALAGGPLVVDPDAARAAAQRYLADNGARGEAVVAADGRTIHVTVDGEYDTALLGVIGIGSMTVHGEGSAALVHGVGEAENG